MPNWKLCSAVNTLYVLQTRGKLKLLRTQAITSIITTLPFLLHFSRGKHTMLGGTVRVGKVLQLYVPMLPQAKTVPSKHTQNIPLGFPTCCCLSLLLCGHVVELFWENRSVVSLNYFYGILRLYPSNARQLVCDLVANFILGNVLRKVVVSFFTSYNRG